MTPLEKAMRPFLIELAAFIAIPATLTFVGVVIGLLSAIAFVRKARR